jgi:hypothetical protein
VVPELEAADDRGEDAHHDDGVPCIDDEGQGVDGEEREAEADRPIDDTGEADRGHEGGERQRVYQGHATALGRRPRGRSGMRTSGSWRR